jgi:fermentation-respiration switch protein FrsA (DUF1100 family)
MQSVATGLAAGTPIPATSTLVTALRPFLTPDRNAYFKALFALNPATLAAAVHVPMLVVQGGKDPAISATDTQLLTAAAGPRAEALVAATSDHTLNLPKADIGASAADQMAAMHSGLMFEPPPRDAATLTSIGTWLRTKLATS